MSLLQLRRMGHYVAFDEAQCRAAGKDLAEHYWNAEPFPHVIIDDFLDADVLREVLAAYPPRDGKNFYDREQERLKCEYHPSESQMPIVHNMLAELNGKAFLSFLEELTGLQGLISDPNFTGGGLHETLRGGHLGIHADFNIHHLMKVERRLNLLIYLNEDWQPGYGGALELWNRNMTACEVKTAPVFGRAVIFSTNLDSYHGHPEPLACPPERSRRSIATYYYTSAEQGLDRLPHRTTTFQVRPGSQDRTDWAIRWGHFIVDWVPPAARRIVRNRRGRNR